MNGMNIINGQGIGPAVVDAVAPFLREVSDVLWHFEEPEVYVGDGAVVASMHLRSKGSSVSGAALEQVMRAARDRKDGGVLVSCSGDHRIVVAVYGFRIF